VLLSLGGADDLSNMGPAHALCAGEKTRADHANAAKAKRQKVRHIGAGFTSRRPHFGRTSPFKRKLTGEVVSGAA
jgi:hypothetical protein